MKAKICGATYTVARVIEVDGDAKQAVLGPYPGDLAAEIALGLMLACGRMAYSQGTDEKAYVYVTMGPRDELVEEE